MFLIQYKGFLPASLPRRAHLGQRFEVLLNFWQQTTNRASRNIQKSQISESELISKV